MVDRLLTPAEVAGLLGVRVSTLATWRTRKGHPLAYVKLGKAIRYRSQDVESFINKHVMGGSRKKQK